MRRSVRNCWRVLQAALLGAGLWVGTVGPAFAQGQAQAQPHRPVEGTGGFTAGWIALDLGALNARLAEAGLPGLDETVPVWGGGGYGRVGDFLFGVELHGGLDPAVGSGSRGVSLKGGYGLVRSRYRAPVFGALTVYPSAGIGAGALWLQLAEPGAPDFGDVLADPKRTATLSTGPRLMFDVGIGIEYRIRTMGVPDRGGGGLLLGLETGYLFDPGGTSWDLDGLGAIDGGPKVGIEGFYLWVSLGGWGRGWRAT